MKTSMIAREAQTPRRIGPPARKSLRNACSRGHEHGKRFRPFFRSRGAVGRVPRGGRRRLGKGKLGRGAFGAYSALRATLLRPRSRPLRGGLLVPSAPEGERGRGPSSGQSRWSAGHLRRRRSPEEPRGGVYGRPRLPTNPPPGDVGLGGPPHGPRTRGGLLKASRLPCHSAQRRWSLRLRPGGGVTPPRGTPCGSRRRQS
jgi:hypothetical protein